MKTRKSKKPVVEHPIIEESVSISESPQPPVVDDKTTVKPVWNQKETAQIAVKPLEKPPEPNIVDVAVDWNGNPIQHNADIPLSQLMRENEEVCCIVCGKPLPLHNSDQKIVYISGEQYSACRKCNV